MYQITQAVLIARAKHKQYVSCPYGDDQELTGCTEGKMHIIAKAKQESLATSLTL